MLSYFKPVERDQGNPLNNVNVCVSSDDQYAEQDTICPFSNGYMYCFRNMANFKFNRCKSKRCKLCPLANSYQIDNSQCNKIFCKVYNSIYCLTCNQCNMQYIGQTQNPLNIRINLHRSQIKRFGKNHVQESNLEIRHFQDHNFDNIRVSIIDIVTNLKERLWWENCHIEQYGTIFPYGLNTVIYSKIYNMELYRNGTNIINGDRKYKQSKRWKRGGRNRHVKYEDYAADFENFIDNLVSQKDYRKEWIKNKIYGIKKRYLMRIWFLWNEHPFLNKDFNYDRIQETHVAMVFDMFRSRARYLNVVLKGHKSNNVVKTKEYCMLTYQNKAFDHIPFNSIFKELQNLLPIMNIRVGITYRYVKTVGRNLYNYNSVCQHRDEMAVQDCNCSTNEFCNPDHGHIISGNLNLLKQWNIKHYFTEGTKFRVQKFRKVRLDFIGEIDVFIYKMAVKYSLPIEVFSEWRNAIINNFDLRYRPYFCSNTYNYNLNNDNIEDFRRQFVITYMDKVNSNFAFTCKLLYQNLLTQHYGNTNMYSILQSPRKTIENRIRALYKRINYNIGNFKFPYIVLIPKMHKKPVKFRPVTVGYGTYLKIANDKLLTVLKPIMKKIKLMGSYMISNSYEVIRILEKHPDRIFLRSFDFSDLFNNVNLEVLSEFLILMFEEFNLQTVMDFNYFKTLVKIVLFENVLYDGNIFYKQLYGIPMGGSSSSILADLYLYKYEAISHINNELVYLRFVDDLLTGSCEPSYNLDFSFYPESLILIETPKEPDGSLNFLDINIKNCDTGGGMIFNIYDKRTAFDVKINCLISWNSNLHKNIFRNIVINHFLRNKRLITNKQKRINSDRNFIHKALSRGYPRSFMKRQIMNVHGTVGLEEFEDMLGV